MIKYNNNNNNIININMRNLFLIITICLVVFYFIYKKKKYFSNVNNNSGFVYNNNLIRQDGIMNIIWLIQGHNYMLKHKLENNKFLINNYKSKKECEYFVDIVKKYNYSDDQTGVPPEFKKKHPTIAFDHILANQLINKNKSNNIEIKELNKAKNKFLTTVYDIVKLCEKKFNKKLRLHSADIVCAFKGFSIPSHIDNNHFLVERKENKMYHIMGEDQGQEGYTRIPVKNFIDQPIGSDKNNFNPEKNIIYSNNINSYNFEKHNLDHSNDPYSGGGNDTHAVVSAILYLSTYNEDFTGGELLFGIDKKILPKKGTLLMFTGGPENLHEVLPVLKGERASLLVWCSDKPGKFKRNRIFSGDPTYV